MLAEGRSNPDIARRLYLSSDPRSCRGHGTAPVARLGHTPVHVAVGGIAIRAEPFRPTATTGVPAVQPGATPAARRQDPKSLSERGVNRCRWRALLPMPRLPRSVMLLRETLAGTTVHTFPGTLGHLPAWFWQYKSMNRLGRLSANPDLISPYKRGATGSNPVAPTSTNMLGGFT